MTSLIFCQKCAPARGYFPPTWDLDNNNYTGVLNQQIKFKDHTITGHRAGRGPVSILRDPSYLNYKRLMTETIQSGICEVDVLGRLNMLSKQGKDIGDKLVAGVAVQAQDLFKSVKIDTATGAHGFSYKYPGTGIPLICVDCGLAF